MSFVQSIMTMPLMPLIPSEWKFSASYAAIVWSLLPIRRTLFPKPMQINNEKTVQKASSICNIFDTYLNDFIRSIYEFICCDWYYSQGYLAQIP